MSDLEQLPSSSSCTRTDASTAETLDAICSLDELRTWKERQVLFSIIDSSTGEDMTARILS
jgi:hypothetical protein